MEFLIRLIAEALKALDGTQTDVWPVVLGFFLFLFVSFIIFRGLQTLRRRRLMEILGELASQTGLQLGPARPGGISGTSSSPSLSGLFRGRRVFLSVDGGAGSENGPGGDRGYTRVRLELNNPGDCLLDIRPRPLLGGMFRPKQALSADPAFDRRLRFRGSPPNFLRRALQLAPRYPALLGRQDGVLVPTSALSGGARRLPRIRLEGSSLDFVQPGTPGNPYVELSILNFLSELADLAELEAADHPVFQRAPLRQAPSAVPELIDSRRRTPARSMRMSIGAVLRLLFMLLPVIIWILSALPQPSGEPERTGSGGEGETQSASMRSTDIARFSTTGTAQVTASAAARSTSTVIARSTKTAMAAATDESRKMYVATVEASRLNADGPYTGRLKHESSDALLETFDLSRKLKNLVAQVTFLNPYSAKATGPWAYGLMFRVDYEQKRHYRLVLHSNKEWQLLFVTHSDDTVFRTVASGRLLKLNTEKDGSNSLWILARDDKGLLFVNGVYVADLDLSEHQEAGEVSIATGMDRGAEIQGYSTGYEDFTVWELP